MTGSDAIDEKLKAVGEFFELDGWTSARHLFIPAGFHVITETLGSERVVGHDPSQASANVVAFALGVAGETLREGFRVRVRDDGVYEDDA